MKILRTWKVCENSEINAVYDAVKSAAERLYPQYFEKCEYYFFINSSKKCLGKCVYDFRPAQKGNKAVVILLSRYVTQKRDVLRVLIHEFAHAVTPFQNHSAVWRSRAEKIGSQFGESDFRAYCKTDERVRFYENSGVGERTYRYVVRCEKCGRVAGRERLCNLILHPEKYRCARCGGKFKRVF